MLELPISGHVACAIHYASAAHHRQSLLCTSALLMNAAGMYGPTSNGHAAGGEYSERYSTRCATGVIQRKRYDRVFSDDDDDGEDDNDTRRGRRMLVRSRRSRTATASDSDDVQQTATKSASSGILQSSSSTLRYSHQSEGDLSDTETASDAGGSQSGSSESGSDTEAYSEDSGPVGTSRMTRSAAGGRPHLTNGHVTNRFGIDAKYRTRNQGRRTVHYEEADSDMDYDGKDGRRTLVKRRTEVGSRARLYRS